MGKNNNLQGAVVISSSMAAISNTCDDIINDIDIDQSLEKI
jgi:hypothetical protein